MKIFENYLQEFSDITVEEALTLLGVLEVVNEKVIVFDSNKSQNIITTPKRICWLVPKENKAFTVGPIQFCGGPPNEPGWFTGTLLTLVLDKIMYNDAMFEINGMKLALGGVYG